MVGPYDPIDVFPATLVYLYKVYKDSRLCLHPYGSSVERNCASVQYLYLWFGDQSLPTAQEDGN